MRNLRLISTAAAILLLGAGAVSAQGTKTDETPAAPAAQQNAPPEKIAPAAKTDPIKAPEKSSQAAPAAPTSDKQQTTDKGAPAGTAAKSSSAAIGSTDVKAKRAERHVGGRYASGYHGPLYNSYTGDLGYRDCRGHRRHSWMPWLGC